MPSDVPFCLGEQKDPCILPVLKELNVIQMNLLERDFLEGCPFFKKEPEASIALISAVVHSQRGK
jgi:hypothetical protein